MDVTVNEQKVENKDALDWMRANAPEALKNASDEELLDNMSKAWTRHMSDSLLASIM